MAILMLLIVFLFPVAIYLSILAAINRRTQPVLVPGHRLVTIGRRAAVARRTHRVRAASH